MDGAQAEATNAKLLPSSPTTKGSAHNGAQSSGGSSSSSLSAAPAAAEDPYSYKGFMAAAALASASGAAAAAVSSSTRASYSGGSCGGAGSSAGGGSSRGGSSGGGGRGGGSGGCSSWRDAPLPAPPTPFYSYADLGVAPPAPLAAAMGSSRVGPGGGCGRAGSGGGGDNIDGGGVEARLRRLEALVSAQQGNSQWSMGAPVEAHGRGGEGDPLAVTPQRHYPGPTLRCPITIILTTSVLPSSS